MSDPFRHHPGLRGLVKDPETSFFRDLTRETIVAMLEAQGLDTSWVRTDAEREGLRRAALLERPPGDLWVFAYGSLMWDPGVIFREVRRAHAPGHRRRFILRDANGGRGTPEAPGLMAALDAAPGEGADGLVFRIAEAEIEAESARLFQREAVGPAYHARWIAAETAEGPVAALAFVADHDAPDILAGIGRAAQVRMLATGAGTLGTSLDYLRSLARHLEELRIADAEVEELLAAAEAAAG